MSKGQFRFSYFTRDYESTVAFYRDGLELPVIESWDRGPDDRGILFGAASGIIEVLTFPRSGHSSHLWDDRPPQGAFMAMEVDDIESRYRRAVEKGLMIKQELTDQEWGHKSFCVSDPNGLTLYLFTEAGEKGGGGIPS
jgi:catechol 2,3-dioxygenase-like lactoylglutathione lyase family enzyme